MSGDAYWWRNYFNVWEPTLGPPPISIPPTPFEFRLEDVTVRPDHAFEPSPFDFAMADAVRRLERDNPPPPDALLPEGCSRWWPRVDVVDREEGLCARLTWEARK